MTVEKFNLKLVKEIALVFSLSGKTKQSDGYVNLISQLTERGGEEVSPDCFLIAGIHKNFLNDMTEHLDFMNGDDSLLIFNGLEMEAGATFWVPQKTSSNIYVGG